MPQIIFKHRMPSREGNLELAEAKGVFKPFPGTIMVTHQDLILQDLTECIQGFAPRIPQSCDATGPVAPT